MGLGAGGRFHNKFDRSRAHVIHGAGRSDGRLAHLVSNGLCHSGGRGFFQYFLVAALNRTIALEQVHIVAQCVTKDLNFNVARALYVLLNQHRIVAKTTGGFTLARGQGSGKVFRLFNRAHAFAAAACAGFDQNGVAYGIGFALQ